jgi:Cof subfamily protein (haloacid dehalogenase superfamily)
MPPIRLIAVDIDGTLLDSRGRIPDENREALAEAAARGIEICLVTGRSFSFSRPIADELAQDVTLVVSNGAMVKTRDGLTRVRRLLQAEVAREVLTAALDHRHALAVVFDRGITEQVVYETMDWSHPNRRRYYEKNRASIVSAVPLESALIEDPVQVMFNGGVAAMREVLGTLKAKLDGRVEIALTEYLHRDFSLLDVLAKGCSKGSTLADWVLARGFDAASVMAVGDNFNDEQMLEFAGVPVVMGNAVEVLKTRGWPVTLTHDEAGLAAAIRRFALAGSSSSP